MYGMNGWNKDDGGDLISRAAAIGAVNTALFPKINTAKDAEKALRALPSAQPTQNTRVNSSNALDTISRQAALEALDDYILDDVTDSHGDSVREILERLPSAQPEIKPIDYQDCANAMLRMWMDKVVTDGEYNRIMDKLNAFWRTRNERPD